MDRQNISDSVVTVIGEQKDSAGIARILFTALQQREGASRGVLEVRSQISKNIFNLKSTTCAGERRGSTILLFKLESGSKKVAREGDHSCLLSTCAQARSGNANRCGN
jgi:hypothetical protein